ncbi:uncharacterized protein L969DRAFT_67429 [Mixia osmundae IAM 14324]|uniref:Exonuclease domain-containing protein n=1 Tax=Mixia osmundae (strain CBS 9802 / IAM 14324 / JCM 22182 / KY 12970) TaxID=764103 RepID=G7DW44_MIXOS|nr:uncharacterized protein L969DRAFT_67429 [Mixia osmundae IAM 14324]KEI36452.1 hypothetical protein L969DRAFT_67429 [Mixia osmundae IAM 14324]GAA94850.1 hypothetical protein E5Q_01504 [Mixia osmundae IAM 14324]
MGTSIVMEGQDTPALKIVLGDDKDVAYRSRGKLLPEDQQSTEPHIIRTFANLSLAARDERRKNKIMEPMPGVTRPECVDYDAYLVCDVEATCEDGAGYTFPNEIIELPITMLRWRKCEPRRTLKKILNEWELYVHAEFHTYVQPTWNKTLSKYCEDLTGISQAQVDRAPSWREALKLLSDWVLAHGIQGKGKLKSCFITDGPWDLRDFVPKTCWINGVSVPPMMTERYIDLRLCAATYFKIQPKLDSARALRIPHRKPDRMDVPSLLDALGLPPFEGRQHSGRADTRNTARVVMGFADIGWILIPTLHELPRSIPNNRWPWQSRSRSRHIIWPVTTSTAHAGQAPTARM